MEICKKIEGYIGRKIDFNSEIILRGDIETGRIWISENNTGTPINLDDIPDIPNGLKFPIYLNNSWVENQTELQNEFNEYIHNELNMLDLSSGTTRVLREYFISVGYLGYNNKIQTVENQAITLRGQLIQ